MLPIASIIQTFRG